MSDEPEGPPLAPVVRIRPGVDLTDEERPLAERKPERPEGGYCWHWRLELDGKARRVYCRDCGQEIPAYDALDELRRHWDRFIMGRKEAERRAKVARANLDELLRVEANAKARVRAARKRGDPEVVKALRELVRIVKRDHHDLGSAAEASDAVLAAERALYRHGQQLAREGEEPPVRGTARPGAGGEPW